MRHRIATVAVILTAFTAVAIPQRCVAQTVGIGPSAITAGEARDIALTNGVIAIRKIEFDDGKWKVEGQNEDGLRVEMEIDPRTGEIARLERFD